MTSLDRFSVNSPITVLSALYRFRRRAFHAPATPAPQRAGQPAALTAWASRARVRSRPSSSIDSYSGGETRRPVTAARTGANAALGLSPGPGASTSAAVRAALIASHV